jgi:hypothetical protein
VTAETVEAPDDAAKVEVAWSLYNFPPLGE